MLYTFLLQENKTCDFINYFQKKIYYFLQITDPVQTIPVKGVYSYLAASLKNALSLSIPPGTLHRIPQ